MDRRDSRPIWRFRQATTEDTAAAQATYRAIMAHLADTVDFPHWHSENHPTPAEVESWANAGQLYLAVDDADRIAGVVALDHSAPEAYQDVAWMVDAHPGEVVVVHALGVSPEHLRQGVATFLVDGTLEVARAKGSRAVRLDTYVDNLPARELYARYGFTDVGLHTLRYEGTALSQFHLFEYVL